jgi:four helix bundle protein
MGIIRSYRDLEVWQLAMKAARKVYLLTRQLPRVEQFGLISQMRRASVSVPSNIAEGHARSTASFLQFLSISLGSLAELDTQLLLTADLYPQTQQQASELCGELGVIGRRVRSLMQRIEKRT